MVKIQFDKLNIDTISESSGVFSGDNVLIKWKSKKIKNEGFGSLSGNNNRSINNKSMVIKETTKNNNP